MNVLKKYEQISDEIRRQIREGSLAPGARIPTERELAEQFGVSRPTVIRALNDLAGEGLIERRVGSGSFVSVSKEQGTFGLLVPGLGQGEIFEPVCARIAEQASAANFTLLWAGSHSSTKTREQIIRTVDQYISSGVDGVFFQPAELNPSSKEINIAVIKRLQDSRIPVVLLDADYLPFPERSKFDIVGIDNIRAAWVATDHLLAQGAERIDFVTRPFTATTENRRIDGYRLSLQAAGIEPRPGWIHSLEPEDLLQVRKMIDVGARDLLCINDEMAALLMVSLEKLGYAVPSDLRIIGFDDIKYARLVRVPLTTLRQPCAAIGDSAVAAMRYRLAHPDHTAREILLEAELMVRESSRR